MIYITDDKYRLPACVDERTCIYEKKGEHVIYHIALEHPKIWMNYGMYANGLLVESASEWALRSNINMILIKE